ncbi:hypothetical protein [Fusicatenibacter saccharivorans]|uniref:hypothetical protein n=1 Tax=Fusicatenibacter saccharivorans TaxID=1150298 RepID=UPI0032C0279E
MKCTECGKELTAEEQSQGTCSSCGKKIETPATSNTSEEIYTTLVGQSLKIVGIIVLVGGFIGSFLIGKDSYGYLSYGTFFLYCAVSIISGLLIAGVGEIINLLYTICKKMK